MTDGGHDGPITAEEIDGALDLAHLRAQTFDDRGLEREVLALFLRQSADLLAAIEDGADRAGAAHKLLGSARGIGAPAVAAAAARAERILLADPAARDAGLPALRRALAAATAAIGRLSAA